METFNSILDRMTEKYEELSGNKVSRNSDIWVRLNVLAGELYSSFVNAQWLKRQMFASTALGENLDYHAQTRGLKRRESSYATGSVAFCIELPVSGDVPVPKGTVVATTDIEPLRFETTEDGVIPAGETMVSVPVKSLGKGRKYNVKAGKITVMVTPPSSVHSVINTEPCVSGADTESDESLRERIIESYAFASNGTNCAYYKTMATETEGVAGAGVVPRGRGAGTVDVYISAQGAQVSDEVLSAVQEKLQTLREVNVDVKVMRAEAEPVHLYIYLDAKPGYEFDEVCDSCRQVIEEYISSRGVGGSVLLNQITDLLCDVDGVADFYVPSNSNFNLRCPQDKFPAVGKLTFKEGVT